MCCFSGVCEMNISIIKILATLKVGSKKLSRREICFIRFIVSPAVAHVLGLRVLLCFSTDVLSTLPTSSGNLLVEKRDMTICESNIYVKKILLQA